MEILVAVILCAALCAVVLILRRRKKRLDTEREGDLKNRAPAPAEAVNR
jgi:hypothetical protein